MNFKLVLLLCLLKYSSAQDANCDFYQEVAAGTTRYIDNPNYPNSYNRGQTCRWILVCPVGYNCRLDCPVIRLPQSTSCTVDRLLVSLTGDPYLVGAQSYCGTGSLSVVSSGRQISLGLITSQNSPGGTFRCQVTPQLATPTPPTCTCGVKRQNRIVGGVETGVNEYPMMAGLADLRISQIKCGGVIISNLHVLTAGHCVVGQSVNNYGVVVGEHDVNTGDSPATKAYRISRFTVHPSYTSSNYDYDIAIVTVTDAIVFSDRVLPVCLPFKYANSDFAGSKVTVLGWGTLFAGGPTSNVLRKVDLDVLSQTTCRNTMPAVTNRQMCTFTYGKDACQDDSGGPLLYTEPATGLLFSVGIVSYGQFCATTTPGLNTRITVLLNWITSNTPGTNYCVK